uniref:DNA mismatch repair protein PMS1 n=1 Tax=Bionectria ochroleuca TaxID=29856 RepID=A0A8H7N8Z2_BIOOC
MATIKQIDGRTIHRIQSGQVIVDLCSVVKELVENSIDAGASTIDVRFKNQGLDLIEVQDNGSGIAPANYESIALKHHTSKLSSYDDIGSLETFGFRGEALASLCALSTVSITTCVAADVPKGSRLAFEASGKLRDTSVVAAQRGTTVAVEKLFHNLPVRRRELERNIKREWHKVIALLNQYACVQTNLKFTVSQQPTKGRRIVLFSTKGNPTTRENIINIFGAKTMAALVPLDLKLEMKPTTLGSATQADLAAGLISLDVKIVGHVSRPVHGEGRQTPDRQMFFINGRPCGLPQFAKTFNEVYRSYNSSQSPFILADVQLDTHLYDVNVSPDKRTILLHDQNHMLDSIRSALVGIFDSQDYTLPTSQVLRSRNAQAGETTPISPLNQSSSTGQATHSKRKIQSRSEASQGSGDERSSSEDDEGSDSLGPGQMETKTTAVPKPVTIRKVRNTLDVWVHGRTAVISRAEEDEDAKSQSSDGDQESARAASSRSVAGSNTKSRSRDAEHSRRQPSDSDTDQEPKITKPASVFPLSSSNSPSSLANDELTIPFVKPIKPISRGGLVSPRRHSTMRRPPPQPAKIFIGATGGDPEDVGSEPSSDEGDSQHSKDQASDDEPDSDKDNKEEEENDDDDDEGDDYDDDDRPTFGTTLSQRFSAGRINRQRSPSFPRTKRQMGPDTSTVRTKRSPGSRKGNEQISDDENSPAADPILSPRSSPSYERIFSPSGAESPIQRKAKGRHITIDPSRLRWRRCYSGYPKSSVIDWTSRLVVPFYHPQQQQQQVEDIGATDAESKLSLIISKSDFAKMRVAGQFNLGFIIAVRPAEKDSQTLGASAHDELFIIDQHASDEKYNFERLQGSTVVQSQRLVHPKLLELTALEEEIVMQNIEALEANGFNIAIDVDGGAPVGSRCQLTALPLSRETTFSITDLEELIALLADESSESTHIPRPSKVRKMFAMRACRSSIMIGKALTRHQMYSLVGHMGDLDKPWNCPHGRPTMRHLFSIDKWDEVGWKGDLKTKSTASWTAYRRGE